MKNLQKISIRGFQKGSILLALILGCYFFSSCEKEESIDQEVSLGNDLEISEIGPNEVPIFIEDDRTLSTIATLGTVSGEFGDLYVNKYGGQVITLSDLSDYNPKTAGYIHYDIDVVNFTEEEFEELNNWADDNNACLLFESGSKNSAKMKEFYTTFLVNETPSYDVKGVLIKNSSKSLVTRTILISDDMSLSPDSVIKYHFNGVIGANNIMTKSAPSYVKPTSVKTYPDKKRKCVRNRCTTTLGTPLYTTTNQFMNIPNDGYHSVTNVKYSSVNGSMAQYSQIKREPIRYGYVHDARLANGEYTCNQTASYGESLTYTKAWTVGLGGASGAISKFFPSLVSKIQDAAFSISPSIGGSKATGSVNSSSFAMKRRRFARGIVYASVYEANLGYWKGTVEYTVRKRYKQHNRWKSKTLYKAKSIFNGYAAANSFASEQPYSPSNNRKTEITFGWDEWGTRLNCN